MNSRSITSTCLLSTHAWTHSKCRTSTRTSSRASCATWWNWTPRNASVLRNCGASCNLTATRLWRGKTSSSKMLPTNSTPKSANSGKPCPYSWRPLDSLNNNNQHTNCNPTQWFRIHVMSQSTGRSWTSLLPLSGRQCRRSTTNCIRNMAVPKGKATSPNSRTPRKSSRCTSPSASTRTGK